MFNIGDIVMVQGCKDLDPVKCKIMHTHSPSA